MDAREKAVKAGQATESMLWDRNRPWAAVIQLEFLYDLALQAPDGPAVECGVWRGGSMICWAQARADRGRIIAVDTWASKTEAVFRHNLERFKVSAEVLTANSWEGPALIGEPVAFCFIDSDHIVGIPQDMRVWPDAMLPGGILAVHDYHVWKPNVTVEAVVDEWQAAAHWEELGLVGAVKAFRRPV